MIEFAGAEGGRIRLSFEENDWMEASAVLIVPYYHGRILFTKHRIRGWELPGGTREAFEFPIQTAIRELYEETGAEAAAIRMIGQYVLLHKEMEQSMIKSIYLANISKIHPLPNGYETNEIKLHEEFPDWQKVRQDPAFSFILKDDVYRHLVAWLQTERQNSNEGV